jgi:hypothetical protein
MRSWPINVSLREPLHCAVTVFDGAIDEVGRDANVEHAAPAVAHDVDGEDLLGVHREK